METSPALFISGSCNNLPSLTTPLVNSTNHRSRRLRARFSLGLAALAVLLRRGARLLRPRVLGLAAGVGVVGLYVQAILAVGGMLLVCDASGMIFEDDGNARGAYWDPCSRRTRVRRVVAVCCGSASGRWSRGGRSA